MSEVAVFNIYKVTAPNGMSYIGCTKHPIWLRWQSHFGNPPRAYPGDAKASMCDAIKRFGRDSFVVEHIASAVGIENAAAAETALIEQHGTLRPNGFNRFARGGGGLNVARKRCGKPIQHRPPQLALTAAVAPSPVPATAATLT